VGQFWGIFFPPKLWNGPRAGFRVENGFRPKKTLRGTLLAISARAKRPFGRKKEGVLRGRAEFCAVACSVRIIESDLPMATKAAYTPVKKRLPHCPGLAASRAAKRRSQRFRGGKGWGVFPRRWHFRCGGRMGEGYGAGQWRGRFDQVFAAFHF